MKSAMVKVCMIVHQSYFFDARVRNYAESLAEAGCHVDVLCLRQQNQPTIVGGNNITIITIPVEKTNGNVWDYIVDYIRSFAFFTAWLLWLYIKNRYHIIHVHNMPDFLVFTAIIPRILGAKLILDIHDPMPEVYISKYGYQTDTIAMRFIRLQEKLSVSFAHAIITANLSFKNRLAKRDIAVGKITVINNIPNSKYFNRDGYEKKSKNKHDHFTLFYPGTIAPRYGLDVAIRALPLLITRIPQLQLVIMGQQVNYVKELIRLVEQLGVASFVQFKQAVPLDEVPRQFAQADLGIYTGLSDPHMDVAMPGKVLEYAFMGVPIIASRLKVLEDSFTDTAIMFFEPGSVEQFASSVLELYDNPSRRDELVRNMDNLFVSTHSWSHERRVYFDLLNHLLSPGEKVVPVDERE